MATSTKKTIKRKVTQKKQVVTKKGVTKKVATKSNQNKKKPLITAKEEQCFWCTDGRILDSLVALEAALASMKKEIFAHHVTKEKNDFADWVGSVLADDACAKDLRTKKTPKTAYTLVVKRLKSYDI